MLPAITIANMALSHIGEKGSLSSIDPPDGSVWAQHCALFYPAALSSLLTRHAWNFATSRAQLVQLATANGQWRYVYAKPAGVLKVLSVFSAAAEDDALIATGEVNQRFIIEALPSGESAIFAHQPDAWARFTRYVSDTSVFSHPFCMALSYQLASFLAGPIIKGDTGRSVSKSMLEMTEAYLQEAKNQDATEGKFAKPTDTTTVPWIGAR